MDIKIQIIVAVLILLAMLYIFQKIRKKELGLKYALAWIIMGIALLLFDLCPPLLVGLTSLVGIQLPINMLFFIGFLFSLTVSFVLTISQYRLANRLKELTQEVALYQKREQERIEKLNGHEAGNATARES